MNEIKIELYLMPEMALLVGTIVAQSHKMIEYNHLSVETKKELQKIGQAIIDQLDGKLKPLNPNP